MSIIDYKENKIKGNLFIPCNQSILYYNYLEGLTAKNIEDNRLLIKKMFIEKNKEYLDSRGYKVFVNGYILDNITDVGKILFRVNVLDSNDLDVNYNSQDSNLKCLFIDI